MVRHHTHFHSPQVDGEHSGEEHDLQEVVTEEANQGYDAELLSLREDSYQP